MSCYCLLDNGKSLRIKASLEYIRNANYSQRFIMIIDFSSNLHHPEFIFCSHIFNYRSSFSLLRLSEITISLPCKNLIARKQPRIEDSWMQRTVRIAILSQSFFCAIQKAKKKIKEFSMFDGAVFLESMENFFKRK